MNTPEPSWTRRLVAWCPNGQFHDGDYLGPRHPCPANPDCNDGKGHYLRPRKLYICHQCGWASRTTQQAKDHQCQDWDGPAL